MQQRLSPAELFKNPQFPPRVRLAGELPQDVAGLFGPFTAQGECLEPLIFGGDALYIDPTAEPVDGDLVVFDWPDDMLQKAIAAGKDQAWREKYGNGLGRTAAKMLKHIGREPFRSRWMVCNETLHEVKGHKVHGPVALVVRQPVCAGDINAEAATELFETSDGGLVHQLFADSGDTFDEDTILSLTFTPPTDGTVVLNVNFETETVGSAGSVTAEAAAFVTQSSVTTYGQTSDITGDLSVVNRKGYTVQGTFPVTGGSLVTCGLYASLQTITVSYAQNFYNVTVVAVLVKR